MDSPLDPHIFVPTPFSSQEFGILYFSRGRGRGHAIPDMAIGNKVIEQDRNVVIKYASYAAGAEAFRACGYEVLDLDMPEDPDPWEALVKQARLTGFMRPRLVVAHEECQALVAARIFDCPSVFITDFFLEPSNHWTRALQAADEVVFVGENGLFTEPPCIRTRIRYVGPAIRTFDQSEKARARARERLGLSEDTILILCQPGNHNEHTVPLSQVVARLWTTLPIASKELIWIAGRDYPQICSDFEGLSNVRVIEADWTLDQTLIACDLVITKGNRITVYEAASLGIPTISVTSGVNWPDDVSLKAVPSNILLDSATLSPDVLMQTILQRLGSGRSALRERPMWDGAERAALRLVSVIDRLRLGLKHDDGLIRSVGEVRSAQ